MADPTKYTPAYSYSGWQATNPSRPLPADEVDNDFANVSRSVNQTIDALKDVRRSDGKLKNQSVGPDQLSPALTIGFTFTGTWVDGRSYGAGDGVVKDDTFYSARVSHTADVSNAPGNDAYWNELFSLNDIVVTGGMALPRDSFVGDGVTKDFTLSFTPLSKFNLFVQVGGVVQGTDAYSSNGNTLSFISPPPNGYGIEVRGFATVSALVVPEDGSVSTEKLADDAVTDAKLSSSLRSRIPALAASTMLVDNALGTAREAKPFADVRSFLNTAPYVATRAALKALDTTKDTTAILTENGREGIFNLKAGDYSAQIAADTFEGVFVEADDTAATSGAWVRVHDGALDIRWFGATRVTVAQVSSTALYAAVADSSDNVTCAYTVAALMGWNVTGAGVYKCTKRHDIPSGIAVCGLGTNEAWEIPFFDIASMTLDRGLTFIMTGTGTRDLTLDYCSAMHHSGAYRTNISRPYVTANDQYFEATDFTNGNASGATKATLKSFSAAVTLGSDGLSGKTILSNVRFVPACDDGANGPLSGYLAANANNIIPWDEWDVGIVNYSPYTTIIEDCQPVGFWHMKDVVQTSIRFGSTTSGGRGEMAIYQRNWLHGGIAVRNGDFYPVLSKTATSVTIAWSPGHRFDTSGTIFIDSTSYAYTGLTYNAAGSGTLEFTGIASTTNVETSGDSRSIVHMTNNNGTTQTVFRDNNIRDFWHPSLVERPSTAFGAQAGKYSAAVELVGYPIRGITFENNTIYTSGPLFLLQIGARNIFWKEGTYEEKDYRTALGGALNPSGLYQGLAIVGPDSANIATWPMLPRGDATLYGYPWSGRLNIGPVGIVESGRRYSAFNDCFNGYRFQWLGEPSTDKPIIWDARLPRRYVISSGALTVFDEFFTVDTEGGAATDDLVSITAPAWINRICFKTTASSRDVTIKQGTLAGQFSNGGSDITLFGTFQNVAYIRSNAASPWELEGNYGTAGTFANVTTVGGKVVNGT